MELALWGGGGIFGARLLYIVTMSVGRACRAVRHGSRGVRDPHNFGRFRRFLVIRP
jgi:hypothetical protein